MLEVQSEEDGGKAQDRSGWMQLVCILRWGRLDISQVK